ncbi:MAG TPA: hypothetical protein VGR73_01795 [Bryobacteraceae bacterium]|nr:hypothetical protein [Bryobacteraceae bacterium]
MNGVVAGIAIVGLVIAAAFSIRLAWADFEFRRGTEESVARALRILPNNVQYLLFRALQLDYAGLDSTAELQRAAALSPLSSAPRLRLGLAGEARGDITTAEKWLLEAARVDRQYEPRWTLANFYFRQNRRDDFWTWMRSALEVSYGDRRPAFDLCWRVGKDVDEILTRGAPPQREVLAAMLAYALDLHRGDAGVIALQLATFHDASDVPLLDAACGVLIDSGLTESNDAERAARLDRAAKLWIASGHSPAGGVWNGSFASTPLEGGFDWRLGQGPGIAHVHMGGQGHRIELSGAQPQTFRLLGQFVLLDPGRSYRLEWSARTNELPETTGLVWLIGSQRFPVAASAGWKKAEAVLGAQKRLSSLELWYQRPSGQVRAEGWIELREVSLVPLQ